MAGKTFVLFVFLLIGLSFASRCIERRWIGLLDCSRLRLVSLPHIDTPNRWVKMIELSQNSLATANLSMVLVDYPNVRLIDLRQNPIVCVKTVLIRVLLSNCISTTTTAGTNTLASSSTNIASTFSFVDISSASPTKNCKNNDRTLILLYALPPAGALVTILVFLVCFCVVRSRRRPIDNFELVMSGVPRCSESVLSASSSDSGLLYYGRDTVV